MSCVADAVKQCISLLRAAASVRSPDASQQRHDLTRVLDLCRALTHRIELSDADRDRFQPVLQYLEAAFVDPHYFTTESNDKLDRLILRQVRELLRLHAVCVVFHIAL